MKKALKLERLAAYRQGWKHGACSAYRRKADRPVIDVEYQQGYEDGTEARLTADRKATKRMGITQDELMKRVLR